MYVVVPPASSVSVADRLCGCLSAAEGLSPDTRLARVSRSTFCSNFDVFERPQAFIL